MFEWLSILGGILEVFQLFFLRQKNRIGFLFGIGAGISWLAYTIITKSAFGIYILMPITLTLNITGFIKWKNK